jgi:hypothetical protein
LPDGIGGDLPEERDEFDAGMGMVASVRRFDPFAATEQVQDLFEPEGRVCVWELGGPNPVLKPGELLSLEYRVDAENMTPILGKCEIVMSYGIEDNEE